MRRPVFELTFLLGAAALFASSSAEAHFRLLYPPDWRQDQDPFGDLQKASPCGVSSFDTYTLTNAVTKFAPGQKINVQWEETVAHDGWFRIAVSYKADRSDLVDPTYEMDFLGNSVDASIETPPVPPVIADNLSPHLAAGDNTPTMYSAEITLPTTPCEKCTLQVIQVMLHHPRNFPDPYTYNHCAVISISEGADGGTIIDSDGGKPTVVMGQPSDAGNASGSSGTSGRSSGSGTSGSSHGTTEDDGGTGAGGSSSGDGNGAAGSGSQDNGAGSQGGGCDASGRPATAAAGLGLVLGGLIAATRRRRRKG